MTSKQYWLSVGQGSVGPRKPETEQHCFKMPPTHPTADSQGSSMAQSQHWDRCFGTPRFSIRRLFPLGTNLGREITNVP